MTIGTVADVVKAVRAIDYQTDYRFDEITSVTFDTRLIQPGALFVPLQGTTDGHDYVDQAIKKGAKAVLWGKPEVEVPEGICAIWVDDTLTAFQDLAKWYLKKVNPRVIGVTGSSGKTTTKDMTAAVLGSTFKVHKTEGNFNNEIGLPQTILNMPEDTEKLVLEMGMSEFGEISFLSQLAQPNVVVITMIGESHIENLGSRQGIAKAKLEIVDGLTEDGKIIFPYNEPLLHEGVAKIMETRAIEAYTFGTQTPATIFAMDGHSYTDYATFRTNLDEAVEVKIPVLGEYNIQNALVALLVGELGGVQYEDAVAALAEFKLTANRSQWLDGVNGSRLLNDAYNASPSAMKAVLRAFSNVKLEGHGRRIAVLGDMRELGEQSLELHASVSEAIDTDKIHQVYLYGEQMKALYDELVERLPKNRLFYVPEDKEHLIELVQYHIDPDDLVLIKSSNGTGLLEVVERLKR